MHIHVHIYIYMYVHVGCKSCVHTFALCTLPCSGFGFTSEEQDIFGDRAHTADMERLTSVDSAVSSGSERPGARA